MIDIIQVDIGMDDEVTHQELFKNTLSNASGDADESFCDLCRSVGQWKSVEGYCKICEECYCADCLKVHRRQRITKGHVILDKKQIPRGVASTSNQDSCVEVCKIHHPEIIRFYCKTHDEPGCGDCMTLNHATCKKDRVQDISNGFQATKEFQLFNQKLQECHMQLETLKDKLEDNLKNIDKTYNNILKKISTVRQQLNEYLDQVEKQISDEAAKNKTEDETEVNKFIAENDSMKTEIEDVMQKIQSDSDVNVNSIFIITKQASQRLVEMECDINKIKQAQHPTRYEFLTSVEIENMVSTKPQLGILSRQVQHTENTRKNSRENTRETREPMTTRSSAVDMMATYRGTLNVKTEVGQRHWWIGDCTLLGSNRMVAIDKNNNTINLIDANNSKVLSSFVSSCSPSKLTRCGIKDQFAVTFPDARKVQYFKVKTTTIVKQQDLKLNDAGYGIAYKDGKFAVSYVNPGRIEIIEAGGQYKLLHTILPKQDDADLLHEPFFIAFGHENDTVIISDSWTNQASVVSFTGQLLHTYTHYALKRPRGIAIRSDGVMFVCSWECNSVLSVSPDFQTTRIIINDVMNPQGIAYCDINNRVYISTTLVGRGDINNKITVYDLNTYT